MSTLVKLAIISGAISGLVGVLVGSILSTLFKLKDFVYIPHNRRKALTGKWDGKISQIEGPDGKSIKYPITMQCKVGWRTIKGCATYYRKGRTINLNIKGGFCDQSLFKIEYRNKNLDVIQHGYSIYSLSNDTSRITGKFIGVGIETQGLVYGDVELTKKSS